MASSGQTIPKVPMTAAAISEAHIFSSKRFFMASAPARVRHVHVSHPDICRTSPGTRVGSDLRRPSNEESLRLSGGPPALGPLA
jgi:hypothetical protein